MEHILGLPVGKKAVFQPHTGLSFIMGNEDNVQ